MSRVGCRTSRRHDPRAESGRRHQVTDVFLERHPDWRVRYGSRAVSHGIQDAGYHLAFLAAVLKGASPRCFASYARWAARMLAARGIACSVPGGEHRATRDALGRRGCSAESRHASAPYFDAAARRACRRTRSPTGGVVGRDGRHLPAGDSLSGQRHAACADRAGSVPRGHHACKSSTSTSSSRSLYEIGARWEANKLTVAQEHIATAITQYVMAQIYVPPEDPGDKRGEHRPDRRRGGAAQHRRRHGERPARAEGWRVRFLGTNLPARRSCGDHSRHADRATSASRRRCCSMWRRAALIGGIRTSSATGFGSCGRRRVSDGAGSVAPDRG